MKIEFHTLYWDNTPDIIRDSAQEVFDHFGLPRTVHEQNMPHGLWMDSVMDSVYNTDRKSDLIVFFDGDCIPINPEKMLSWCRYAIKNDTFVGVAQASNHIPPKSHIYAAPAFFAITPSCYSRLGHPSFVETQRSDVAEEICYRAEELGVRYRCLYPSCWEQESTEGVWRLGNYGYYAVGTVFQEAVYHLYQGRFAKNQELFAQRCKEVIEGTFRTDNFHSSTTLDYEGNIVK
jgi:hypothetical protein